MNIKDFFVENGIVAVAVSVILFLSLSGCGSGTKSYPLSGTVTYNGQPVPEGTIRFTPDASKGNQGPQSVAAIVDGRYDMGNNGVSGGPTLVEINGVHNLKDVLSPNSGETNRVGEPIFATHKESVDFPLKASTKDFEITGPEVKIIK